MGSAVAERGSLDCEEEGTAVRVHFEANCRHFQPGAKDTKWLLVKGRFWPLAAIGIAEIQAW